MHQFKYAAETEREDFATPLSPSEWHLVFPERHEPFGFEWWCCSGGYEGISFPFNYPKMQSHFHSTLSYRASTSRQVGHEPFSHLELPVPSSSSHSAMKGSKLLFKQVWPCALLSSGQLFRRHLMLNMELLTEMSYSLLGSWQTAGESQEEQKRFIGKKVFYYRQEKK